MEMVKYLSLFLSQKPVQNISWNISKRIDTNKHMKKKVQTGYIIALTLAPVFAADWVAI